MFKTQFNRGSPSFSRVESFVFCVVYFFVTIDCLFMSVLRIRVLITPLVSSNISYNRYCRKFGLFIIPPRTVLNELSMLISFYMSSYSWRQNNLIQTRTHLFSNESMFIETAPDYCCLFCNAHVDVYN